MRKNLIIAFILISTSLYSRPDSVRRSINRDSKLVHHAVLYSTNTNTIDQFNTAFAEKVEKQNLNFTTYNNIEERPDVVFILDDYESGYKKAIDNQAIPVFVKSSTGSLPKTDGVRTINASNTEQIANQSIQLMKDLYYTGERPLNYTIFTPDTDGYYAYRIPATTVLPNGRILAFAEGRQKKKSDCADNDIVMKYSDDTGRNWSKLIVVAKSSGSASFNNPTVVFVEENNEIIVMFQEYPPNLHEGRTVVGLEGENIVRAMIVKSSDDGKSWSQPRDITKEVKHPNVSDFASGPGAAIRIVSGPNKGRILVPCNAVGGENGWYNYLVYSDDLGETWAIIEGGSQYGTNESQVVQIGDNDLLINARSHRFNSDEDLAPKEWNPWDFDKIARYRGVINVSIDGTKGVWSKTIICKDLPDPQCQAGIARYSGLVGKEPSILIFANPASTLTSKRSTPPYRTAPPKRLNGTISVSFDEGGTWPIKKRFYGNRYTEYQYSQPIRISKNQIGVIFETGNKTCFAVIDIDWVTAGSN